MAGSFVFGQNLAHRLVPGGPVDAYQPQEKDFGSGVPVGFTLTVDHPRIQAFRILKNGAAGVNANEIQQKPALHIARPDGTGAAQANVSSTPAGAKSFTFQAGQSVAVDVFKFGFITTLDTVGSGTLLVPETYPISGNSASGGTANTITVYLAEPLRRPVDSGTTIQISGSDFYNTERGSDSSHDASGVPLVDIPANYYYAAVVKGYIPLKFAAAVATGVNNRLIAKAATGLVELNDNVGRRSIGHLIGSAAVISANYELWGLCYIDLT